MGVWEQVNALVAEGKSVTITLTEAQEVAIPRRALSDRRLFRMRPWESYAGSTDGNRRPRCRANGCTTYLRKNQPLACSDKCERQLIATCLRTLAILRYNLIGRVDEYEAFVHGNQAVACLTEEEKNERRKLGAIGDVGVAGSRDPRANTRRRSSIGRDSTSTPSHGS